MGALPVAFVYLILVASGSCGQLRKLEALAAQNGEPITITRTKTETDLNQNTAAQAQNSYLNAGQNSYAAQGSSNYGAIAGTSSGASGYGIGNPTASVPGAYSGPQTYQNPNIPLQNPTYATPISGASPLPVPPPSPVPTGGASAPVAPAFGTPPNPAGFPSSSYGTPQVVGSMNPPPAPASPSYIPPAAVAQSYAPPPVVSAPQSYAPPPPAPAALSSYAPPPPEGYRQNYANSFGAVQANQQGSAAGQASYLDAGQGSSSSNTNLNMVTKTKQRTITIGGRR